MPSVIEGVLSIEKQADDIVSAARAEAKTLERQAREEVERRRHELAQETTRRIEAFRAQAEARHREAVDAADAELRETLANLDKLDGRALEVPAGAVVARFREL